MKKVIGIVDKVDNILFWISSLTVFLMMAWISVDVILRSTIQKPLPGTIELTGEYFMVLIVYFAVSFTQKVNGHVKVTIVEDLLSKKVNKVLKTLGYILVLIIFVFIGIFNFESGLEYIEQDRRTNSLLKYPLAPALFIISIGFFVLSIRILLENILHLTPKK